MYKQKNGTKYCDANAKALFDIASKKNDLVKKLLDHFNSSSVSQQEVDDLRQKLRERDNELEQANQRISVLEEKLAKYANAPQLQPG